jgi:hypothetical protein
MNSPDNKLSDHIHPLVKQLYENVPDFEKISDHSLEDASYLVYGLLSLYLFKEMVANENPTEFTKKCFDFFQFAWR